MDRRSKDIVWIAEAPLLRPQTLSKAFSAELNAFFKSGGKVVPSRSALEAYKELAERIITGTRGAPVSKASETAMKMQVERLELIDKVLETMK